jgi:hypothetical protein
MVPALAGIRALPPLGNERLVADVRRKAPPARGIIAAC